MRLTSPADAPRLLVDDVRRIERQFRPPRRGLQTHGDRRGEVVKCATRATNKTHNPGPTIEAIRDLLHRYWAARSLFAPENYEGDPETVCGTPFFGMGFCGDRGTVPDRGAPFFACAESLEDGTSGAVQPSLPFHSPGSAFTLSPPHDGFASPDRGDCRPRPWQACRAPSGRSLPSPGPCPRSEVERRTHRPPRRGPQRPVERRAPVEAQFLSASSEAIQWPPVWRGMPSRPDWQGSIADVWPSVCEGSESVTRPCHGTGAPRSAVEGPFASTRPNADRLFGDGRRGVSWRTSPVRHQKGEADAGQGQAFTLCAGQWFTIVTLCDEGSVRCAVTTGRPLNLCQPAQRGVALGPPFCAVLTAQLGRERGKHPRLRKENAVSKGVLSHDRLPP